MYGLKTLLFIDFLYIVLLNVKGTLLSRKSTKNKPYYDSVVENLD